MSIVLYDLDSNISFPRCYDLTTARITVMGDSGCGKTSLILRWLRNTFQPTEKGLFMEDIYHKVVYSQHLFERNKHEICLANRGNESSNDGSCKRAYVEDFPVKKSSTFDIQFLDSEALETTYCTELRIAQIKQSDAFVLCFDPTNKDSFYSIKSYYRRIEETLGYDIIGPVIITCSKCDLFADREVSNEEINDLMNKIGLSFKNDYFEVSAKTGMNTSELLRTTLKKINLHKQRERDECRQNKAENHSLCRKVPSANSRCGHSLATCDSKEDLQEPQAQPASLISSQKEDLHLSGTTNSNAETKTLSSFRINRKARSGCCIIC